MIEEHETFYVIDSTKLKTYMECPRQYFFKFILGWESMLPNVHLTFGIAMHEALEHLLLNGYGAVSVVEAIEKFQESFTENYVNVIGDDHNRKNLPNAIYTIQKYADRWHTDLDDFEVLHTEVAGAVSLDTQGKRRIYYRSDAICKGMIVTGHKGIFSMEHKTGTNNNRKWHDKWLQDVQIGAYNHVLNSVFGFEASVGVVVNGLFPNSPPQLKQNGEPKANASDVEFVRIPLKRNKTRMSEWHLTVLAYYDSIMRDTEILLEQQEEPEVLPCFIKNPESCTNYFGCPFLDYCQVWTNPVRKADAKSERYRCRHWDPRTLVENAKTKLDV